MSLKELIDVTQRLLISWTMYLWPGDLLMLECDRCFLWTPHLDIQRSAGSLTCCDLENLPSVISQFWLLLVFFSFKFMSLLRIFSNVKVSKMMRKQKNEGLHATLIFCCINGKLECLCLRRQMLQRQLST